MAKGESHIPTLSRNGHRELSSLKHVFSVNKMQIVWSKIKITDYVAVQQLIRVLEIHVLEYAYRICGTQPNE